MDEAQRPAKLALSRAFERAVGRVIIAILGTVFLVLSFPRRVSRGTKMRSAIFGCLTLIIFAVPNAVAKDVKNVCPAGYKMIKKGKECSCRTTHKDTLTSDKPEITPCVQKW